LLNDIALEEELAGSEVVLYDLDLEKVEIMAEFGRQLAARHSAKLRIRATVDLTDALEDADFAVSSIGGSGASITADVYGSHYHNSDMHIPAKHGIHQVIGDTCGPAGMMMGLRSIPVYIAICREMEKHCPGVILLNHSNPMAVLMRALHKYTAITSIGICHGVQTGIVDAAKLLSLPPDELECRWIGTNHYHWFTQMRHRGADMLPELLRRTRTLPPPPRHVLSSRLSTIYGYRIVYPDDPHTLEFTPFPTQVAGQADLPAGLAASAREHGYDASQPLPRRTRTRRETRRRFLDRYQAILAAMEMPEEKDSTVTGEGVAAMIGAMSAGRRMVCIANIANQGAIPNLPATAEVEVEAVTDSAGVRPLVMGEAPPLLKALLEKRFVWQELVADAGVTGDRDKALQALLIDEMAIVPEKAEAMLDELVQASRDLLPQFFPKTKAAVGRGGRKTHQ
jgi:alpha-galactosidase